MVMFKQQKLLSYEIEYWALSSYGLTTIEGPVTALIIFDAIIITSNYKLSVALTRI